MQLPLPHSSWLCVPYVIITPFVIASRGTGVSRWLPRCHVLLSSSLLLDRRAVNLVSNFIRHFVAFLKIFLSYSFTSRRLSLTKFSGTSPPVRRRGSARQRGRPHVTSGYSRVKSGTRFGRAHLRVSHASMHAPFIIGTASKRMPKAAKFCCVFYVLRSTTSTNACAITSSA